MYHLLYGELPWFLDVSSKRGQDVIDSILAERDKELLLTKEDKYELDDQLLNVIAKSLSYDSEDRFQSADEFIKAIDGEIKIERQSTKRRILSQQQSDNTPVSYAGESRSRSAPCMHFEHFLHRRAACQCRCGILCLESCRGIRDEEYGLYVYGRRHTL